MAQNNITQTNTIQGNITQNTDDKDLITSFFDDLKSQVASKEIKIIFSEPQDERVLKAAVKIAEQNIAKPILIGDKIKTEQSAKELNIYIENIELIDPSQSEQINDLSAKFYGLRKHKGITLEQAKETVLKPIYFGTMMVNEGMADGLISGATHTTADTIRPALQIIKGKTPKSKVSGSFLMGTKDNIYIFADCAINVNPTSEELAEIASDSYDTAKSFGLNAKVAMLSFSTKGSGKHELADKISKATEIVKKEYPDIIVDGEIQADAAVVEKVCAKKAPDSPLKGEADVLVFPDLNSGNIGYKLVEKLGGATAVGPILQGLKKPVNDLSRGCSEDDIVKLAIITSAQALKQKEE